LYDGACAATLHPYVNLMPDSALEIVTFSGRIQERTGDAVRIVITFTIKDGWFVRAVAEDHRISTFQLDIRGDAVAELLHVEYPMAFHIDLLGDPKIIYWQGSVEFIVDVKLKSDETTSDMRAVLTYQPCTLGRCMALQHAVVNVSPS
jgi:hypothetical protein